MHTRNAERTAAAKGRSMVRLPPKAPGRRQVLNSMRAPGWPALLAALCASGLLFALQQVVHAGVQQGEARNRALAAHADAYWRCDVQRDPAQRASCQAQVSAAHQPGVSAQALPQSTRLKSVALAGR